MNMNERIKLATNAIEKNTKKLKEKRREEYKMNTNLIEKSLKSLTALLLLLVAVMILNILMISIASCETIDESILITINNSTNETWIENLSTCCDWMG